MPPAAAAAVAVAARHPGITVTFPGGKRVDAHVGAFTIATDQPAAAGGAESAPAPFDLFLASIAACAGIYALGFCQARGLATEGLRLEQDVIDDPATHLPARVVLRLTPPRGFPARYREALARAVDSCKVKKTIARAPAFAVELTAADA